MALCAHNAFTTVEYKKGRARGGCYRVSIWHRFCSQLAVSTKESAPQGAP